jgi:hypothetical protein
MTTPGSLEFRLDRTQVRRREFVTALRRDIGRKSHAKGARHSPGEFSRS